MGKSFLNPDWMQAFVARIERRQAESRKVFVLKESQDREYDRLLAAFGKACLRGQPSGLFVYAERVAELVGQSCQCYSQVTKDIPSSSSHLSQLYFERARKVELPLVAAVLESVRGEKNLTQGDFGLKGGAHCEKPCFLPVIHVSHG